MSRLFFHHTANKGTSSGLVLLCDVFLRTLGFPPGPRRNGRRLKRNVSAVGQDQERAVVGLVPAFGPLPAGPVIIDGQLDVLLLLSCVQYHISTLISSVQQYSLGEQALGRVALAWLHGCMAAYITIQHLQ